MGRAGAPLSRLTDRWVMLSTGSIFVGATSTGELVALPSLVVKSRSYLTPTWAFELWLNASASRFAGLFFLFFSTATPP